MIRVNVFEAKARLSEYLDRAEAGERIVICRRNRPVAELRAVDVGRVEPRPIGGAKGRFTVSAAFFEALPDDIVEGFSAGGATYPVLPVRSTLARETPASSSKRRARGKAATSRPRSRR